MNKPFYILLLILTIFTSQCLDNLSSPIKHKKLSSEADTVHEINESVDNENYLKSEFSAETTDEAHYFKYTVTTTPSSSVTAFRFEFDQFSEAAYQNYQVFCTFVDTTTSDSDLITTLKNLDTSKSSCVGGFNEIGYYDGIVEIDAAKKKLGVYLYTPTAQLKFTARLFLRINEKILEVNETKATEDETYSLVPYTVVISEFRKLDQSKILFYSYTRQLQMYYVALSTPYPEKLFSGNILNVFTNPLMVHQKYHDADTMVLLTNPFGAMEMVGEQFKFEVRLFKSDFLLDYFVSSNASGRPINSPLLVNMTECTNPYYVILNYNQAEEATNLFIDQIYGKMRSVSVATTLTQLTWDEMLQDDMVSVDINTRRHLLEANSRNHMDVYKIECDLPLLLNFYYMREEHESTVLDSGDVSILTLSSYQTISVNFKKDLASPEVMIDIFNPSDTPVVILDDGQNEVVYQENCLVKIMPFNLDEPIVIKERAGVSTTRVIVKVGYSLLSGWTDVSTYVKYNKDLNTYAFSFPNDEYNLNYTFANLVTSGTNSEDNVKYCFTTNIGAALKPSQENCYRVALSNFYTLKVFNPLIMYKDYVYDETLTYYVTFKPTQDADTLTITPQINKYSTTERNYEAVNNKVTIQSTGNYSSILTPPTNKDPTIFVQMTVCTQGQTVQNLINDPLNETIVVAEQETISGSNYYRKIVNPLYESQLKLTGTSGVEVFVKHVGLPGIYTPSFRTSFDVTFDQTLNTVKIQTPLTTEESFKYTVLVDKENVITNKGLTLCSFVDLTGSLTIYNKTVTSSNTMTSIQINFNKAGLVSGTAFEAIVLAEQQQNGQMVFLSSIIKGTVGEITTESIFEIKDVYDSEYVYNTQYASNDDMNYYFSYLPTSTYDVAVGAFGIELDSTGSGAFSAVNCAFVDESADAMSMVEAVEEVIENDSSFCVGKQSTVNNKKYNYIFKYQYNGSKPKKLVIKVSNGGYANGNFTVYVKNVDNTKIEKTDYTTQQEYGKDEESKKSIVPYIVDLEYLRGTDTTDYVSKVLFYSQFLEMQMYYIDDNQNAPVLLFTGNIMLVYTKPLLAEQKYHSKKLVLLSENLAGQEHASLGDSFRFHTKMFKSDAQIEYFVSNNAEGRTLNYPLSLEMNTCTSDNNKFYYILNYNKPESERLLHLDMIFGTLKTARIVTEINSEKWDTLISNNMETITNYQAKLPLRTQHMDVVELQCASPILVNVYYNYENQVYRNLKKGDVAIKKIGANQSDSITFDTSQTGRFYYSISLFNPTQDPDVSVTFSDGTVHSYTENALDTGFKMTTPDVIYITNNGNSDTRYIFKYGYSVENEWAEETTTYAGELFTLKNMYTYRFPDDQNKRNFTKVTITVNTLNDETNVKFCYSTNLGIAIGASRENCFRTGKFIPYSLTFISPLIVAKDYKTTNDNYYITIAPFDDDDYVDVEVVEEKYETVNRNFDGFHNVLTLSNGKAKTILSLPDEETAKILVHIQTCTDSSTPIAYTDYNALTGETITSGKVYYNDTYGIYYMTTNTLLENELELTGGISAQVYTKHAAVWEYSPLIQNFKTSFDETQNMATIIKPIFDETFEITVLIAQKGKLADVTLCKLATTADFKTIADYVSTFTSTSSNQILHYIDFEPIGYSEGTEFDLVVYAVQALKPKMEFIYPLINGKVGQVTGVIEVDDLVEKENDIVTKSFAFNSNSNYLYYDFKKVPDGKMASVKISSSGQTVTKIGCVFVSNTATQTQMVTEVNKAMLENRNACLGETQKDNDGFDAIVNANYADGKNRLVVQVIYGLGDIDKALSDNTTAVTIYLRTNTVSLGVTEGKFGQDEPYGPIPYVIDLLKVREQKIEQVDYVSKVMFYSNTREMQMFYINDNSYAPVELFSGNIMLVYTNEDVIREKYNGATTMILITDSLAATGTTILGEQFRFRVNYFNSAKTINYFVSGNPDGRLLNNPTAIEMNSCDQPYYYILNYNKVESEQKKLHIDTIFGEITSVKIATELNSEDWETLITNLDVIDNAQTLLPLSKFHMDVVEVTCSLPLLLNFYYTLPDEAKTTNLEIGDISIFSLNRATTQILELKPGQTGPFVYSFNVFKDGNESPAIQIIFGSLEDEGEAEDVLNIKENGIYTKDSLTLYPNIIISNKQTTGTAGTRIIFKLGYVIESTFTKIQNNIYNNQEVTDRTINLFGYKFETNEKRLNYTSVAFTVSTQEDNVKFCYSTNLGTYINPSLQNCYRVGKTNSYTITVLNPLVMYKNYYDDNVINYYVGFRTVNLDQNITITPKLISYDTTERNIENGKNKFKIDYTKSYSTILTAPKNNDPYIFVHIHVCTFDKGVTYDFYNAYNKSNLGHSGEIQANTKNNFQTIENTKLDTELEVQGDDGVEIFVKHVGISGRYQPLVNDIKFIYDKDTHMLNFSQPIDNEEFRYTVYIDKKGNLKRQSYTLCSITEVTKLAHYNEIFTSSDHQVQFYMNFSKPELKEYEEFDVLVVAEQVNFGKLTILSSVYNSDGESYDPSGDDENYNGEGTNTGLIVIVVVLSVCLVVGGGVFFIMFRKIKKKGQVQSSVQAKATSLAEIKGCPTEKLTQSQVDP